MSETAPKSNFPTFVATWRNFRSALHQFRPTLRRLRFTRLRDVLRCRIDGSLDWRERLAGVDLPASITQRIESIAGQRGLWLGERNAVTLELIAHFRDGLDAGASAESLVESFGEAKQAAKLIRRAKRRCRPLWWQASWWVTRTIGALSGAYILMAVWLSFDKPAITTDYLAVLNEGIEEIPLEDRAWPIYLEVQRRNYVEKHGEEGISNHSIEFSWAPDFEELGPEKTREWIESRQEVIALIRQGATKPRLATPLTADDQHFGDFDPKTGELTRPTSESYLTNNLLHTLLGHVQSMRSYARVLKQDALIAAEAGDAERALADIEAMLGVGDHADESPFLVSGLVKIAIDGITYDLTNELLRESPELFTDEQLKRLAHRVATLDYPAARWLEGERMMFKDIVQRLYSDDGNGDGHLTIAGLRYMSEELRTSVTLDGTQRQTNEVERALQHAAGPAIYLTFATRKQTLDCYEAVVNHLPVLLSQPLWETQPEDWDENTWGLPNKGYQQLQFLPVNLLAPAVQSAMSAVERACGIREGWLIGIALELYRREQGDWPEKLDELAPRWLPELPVDRINGTPLVYKLVDGRPMVYSLGIDADDDRGRPSEDYQDSPWAHRVGPPEPGLRNKAGNHPHNGDWVVWSLLPAVERPPVESKREAGG